ncbi:hypothetical protein BDN67DRAFT_973082 [Paxillus ammoniavirescens]|nr:hypothetical protein BDN67DRAFT_973082 [Paxillus ammoniavirescens]
MPVTAHGPHPRDNLRRPEGEGHPSCALSAVGSKYWRAHSETSAGDSALDVRYQRLRMPPVTRALVRCQSIEDANEVARDHMHHHDAS